MTVPRYSSGETTSTFMIGSSRTAPAFSSASRKAARAAISKAIAEEFDLVVGAVNQRNLDVDHREAGENASAHDRVKALFDAGDVFLGNRTADHLGLEFVACALLVRLDDDLDTRELARTAGLLLVGVVDLVVWRVMVSR